jgi:peptidoglycan hydrolase CwlO-like protein
MQGLSALTNMPGLTEFAPTNSFPRLKSELKISNAQKSVEILENKIIESELKISNAQKSVEILENKIIESELEISDVQKRVGILENKIIICKESELPDNLPIGTIWIQPI